MILNSIESFSSLTQILAVVKIVFRIDYDFDCALLNKGFAFESIGVSTEERLKRENNHMCLTGCYSVGAITSSRLLNLLNCRDIAAGCGATQATPSLQVQKFTGSIELGELFVPNHAKE